MPVTHFIADVAWARSFHYRDFRILWTASTLNHLALVMELVALGWLVLQMSDSPFLVGASFAARTAPQFFLGFLSGAVADRVDRRIFLRFMISSSSLVAGLVAMVLLTGMAQTWHIIILSMVSGSVMALFWVVRDSYVYDIVGPEHALNGLSLSSVGQRIGGILGALVAGVLISVVGVEMQFLAVSGVYLAALISLIAISEEGQSSPSQRDPVLRNLMGYIQLVGQNRTLLLLMVLAATTEIFAMSHFSILPVFARDVLQVGAAGLGIMSGVAHGGGVLGVMLLASLKDVRYKGLLLLSATTGAGVGLLVFSQTTQLWLAVGALIIINACMWSADTLYKMLMQSNVSNEERGRAMGAWSLSVGLGPMGHLGLGGMAGAAGAPVALLINASVLTVAGLAAAIGLSRVRRLE